MKRNWKKLGLLGGIGTTVVAAIFVSAFLYWPVHQFTLDVNPSISITTNRLERVTSIEALNEDASAFLKGYSMGDRHVEAVISDLVDRLILTGYITGGQDNIVMITVRNEALGDAYVEKVNVAIAALLENKQLEYMLINQGWDEGRDKDTAEAMEGGKEALIQKLLDYDAELTLDALGESTLRDLLLTAERMNLSPQEIFAQFTRSSLSENAIAQRPEGVSESSAEEEGVIGYLSALDIAFEKVGGGTLIKFEYDRDDGEYEIEIQYDGYVFDLEIDAFTGVVLKFEREWEEDDKAAFSSAFVIGYQRAIDIAFDKVGGGMLLEFEYDWKDGEYDIEIEQDGYEFDLEIDAFTGALLKFERQQDGNKREMSPSESVIGHIEAIEIALAKVGGGIVKGFEYDREDGEYEIEIKYGGYEYDIEIDAYTGMVLKFERERDDDNKGASLGEGVIGHMRAIEIALVSVGGGIVKEFEFDWDDGEYEIEIKYDGYKYDVEIDAYTGMVLKYEREADDDTKGTPASRIVIGRTRAIEIALARVGGGTVMEFKYDEDDKEYEIEIKYNGYAYELEIDAYTGAIKEFERERDDDAKGTPASRIVIGRTRAIEIALARVGGGTVVEFEYDEDDGAYEIEVKHNGAEYELEIDAFTGAVLEFEIDD